MRILSIMAWVATAAWGVFAAVRLGGLEHGWPLRPAMAYTPYVALGVLVPVGLALVARNWRASAAALVVAAALAAAVLPRWVPGDAGSADGPKLRVLSTNLMGGEGDLTVLRRLIDGHQVDLLSVQELTPEADAVLTTYFPHRVARPQPGYSGTGVYSAYPLTRLAGIEPAGAEFEMTGVTVTLPQGSFELLAAHPMAPVNALGSAQAVSDLGKLPRATPHGAVRILAGDFNATLDFAPLRAVIGSGYRDAADARGEGLTWTWPNLPNDHAEVGGVSLPPVTIDHVLVDERVAVTGYDVFDLPGSDHRPVLAELTLPRTL
ncbi:endonuclease [Longispora fulva]|uniref:Endonuclease/exonuclease/phosphatase (EEP) superfamily protein YafD n=1 Tax=Longispora fulva TaxID=619741 RepID=A0A8J7GIS1_9ACTN|nr:endonuclease/exonuclease/phosphatase family protein [Longispora fulva]MBG6139989.1 endonuclease/exonuclease/phosphatase (EEP) superfamily protein YafD [Longispora fulva]GIG57632.1 endonuclease [Longispora fulva]